MLLHLSSVSNKRIKQYPGIGSVSVLGFRKVNDLYLNWVKMQQSGQPYEKKMLPKKWSHLCKLNIIVI